VSRNLQRFTAISGLSQRKVAPLFNYRSARTVANYLKYPEAYEVRNRCAPDAETVIASLTIDQVAHYLNLPKDERDRWLDAGAIMDDVKRKEPIAQEAHDESVPQNEAQRHVEDQQGSAAIESTVASPSAAGDEKPAGDALKAQQVAALQAASTQPNGIDADAAKAAETGRSYEDIRPNWTRLSHGCSG
jgi:hypothetical protein